MRAPVVALASAACALFAIGAVGDAVRADSPLEQAGAVGHGDAFTSTDSSLPATIGAFVNTPIVAVGTADFPDATRVRYIAYVVTTSDGTPTGVRVMALKHLVGDPPADNYAVAGADTSVPLDAMTYTPGPEGAVLTLQAALAGIGVLDVSLRSLVPNPIGKIASLHGPQWNYNLAIARGHLKTETSAVGSWVRLNGQPGTLDVIWGEAATGYARGLYPVVPPLP